MPPIKQKKEKSFEEVRLAVVERSITLLIAGFGLVAALAWNEAVQALVQELFPLSHSSLIAKFIYAFIVTIILAILSLRLTKLAKKK